ncbi:MAG TPA: M64 family metallopeptidase [Candidatus Polarisedimenticolaceae bacterium]|nr:M64 family metallopeptidase [Candidatus Polarisedimenticolaceae bacterium]
MKSLGCALLLLAFLPLHASERTRVVALRVDREGVALVGSAMKDRPYRPLPDGPAGPDARLEFVLVGPKGEAEVQRRDVYGLCLEHGPFAEDHVSGDTIQLHRETLLVEVPDVPGASLQVSWLPGAGLAPVRLGTVSLDGEASTLTPGTVHWPEEYEDRETYLVYGDESELDRRINVVLVPEGYTYAEKSTMVAHAQALIDFFKEKTPYREHAPFLNYILVFAYSTESGTDQCDCGIVRDTAMRTRFPLLTSSCGHTDNRCLFYGTGNGGPSCDPVTGSENIAAAELRAPAQDVTLVMVNTSRYGGCGGSRAVYSAGNGGAVEIAAHELGHSLAGLADEYTNFNTCAPSAREINTSTNPTEGAWPEWIEEIGAPVAGGERYASCIYHPQQSCGMNTLGPPFCPVCLQQWALRFFGHPRVSPTAPIASVTPASPLTVQAGLLVNFAAATRLAVLGPTTTYQWFLDGLPVASGTPAHTRAFPAPGAHALKLIVTADTNFVKKEKTGANQDQVSWTVNVSPVPEVASVTASRNLADPSKVDVHIADTGATVYDLYVSRDPSTSPFHVAAPADGKRLCGLPAEAVGLDLDGGITGDRTALYFLVTADNGPGVEGPLGGGRTADAACSP